MRYRTTRPLATCRVIGTYVSLVAAPCIELQFSPPQTVSQATGRLFDFDSHRPVRWVNLTGKLPEPPYKPPFLTHFAAGGGEVGEKGKGERDSSLQLTSQIHRVRRAGRRLVCEIKQSN